MPSPKSNKTRKKKKAAVPSSFLDKSSNKNNKNNDTNSRATTTTKRSNRRLKETLQSLHREMDVAEYAKTHNGQYRRVVPKHESLLRTRKRKALEREDDEVAEPELDNNNSGGAVAAMADSTTNRNKKKKKKPPPRRLRGSQKSLTEDVLRGSLPLASTVTATSITATAEEEHDKAEASRNNLENEKLEHWQDLEVETEFGEYMSGDDEEENEEEDNDDDGNEGEVGDEGDKATETNDSTQSEQQTTADPAEKKNKKPTPKKKRGPYKKKLKLNQWEASSQQQQQQRSGGSRRRLFKLRNFKSYKMAQRHGDALGAHARGQPKLAIAQLIQVAKDAPSAPQVYSSLGMVYHDMFQNCFWKNKNNVAAAQEEQQEQDNTNVVDEETTRQQEEIARRIQEETGARTDIIQDAITKAHETAAKDKNTSNEKDSTNNTEINILPQHLQEALQLAQKAYGSYHIAAILCKKDYSLWVRAADTACEIAALYAQYGHGDAISQQQQQHRWYNEAKHDLQTADNLNPPGMDVATKLAFCQMQLGHLSDALTLWTDLVQKSHHQNGQNNNNNNFRHTAWMLYAECMLKIGHECYEWNRGNEKHNDNYMFRRWLRKFSDTFDWKERRLQALWLALEAAAGSNACRALLPWMQQRVLQNMQQEQERQKQEKEKEQQQQQQQKASNNAEASLETEKQLLLQRNEKELEAFDQTTENMLQVLDHDTSQESSANRAHAVQERETERSKMTETHTTQINKLVDEYEQEQHDGDDAPGSTAAEEPPEDKDASSSDKATQEQNLATVSSSLEQRDMPLAASVREVSSIAAELMRHMLSMDIYEGGRLVGEAVSLYMRERAQLHDRRVAARRKLDQTSNIFGGSLFSTQFQSYDEVNDDVSDEEDSDAAYISDEDDLDTNDELLDSIRHGVLPPEISVLYALCLIQEGGRNFIAKKCMNSIEYLDQEPLSWLAEDAVVASINSPWSLFRSEATEPLGKTSAFALVADILHRTGKETEALWSDHFVPMFGRFVSVLKELGLTEELHNEISALSPATRLRRDQVLKVILAWGRLQVHNAKAKLASKVVFTEEANQLVKSVVICLKSLKQYLDIHDSQKLVLEFDGSVSAICIEILDIFAHGYSLLLKDSKSFIQRGVLEDVLKECDEVLAWMCGVGQLVEEDESPSIEKDAVLAWKHMPISSSWQTKKQKAMSLRCYNLCVAFNVSHYSGWEPNEFSLRSINKNFRNSIYFGLHMDGKQVAGFLPPLIEEELTVQWDGLADLLPVAKEFDFRKDLAGAKKESWYEEGVDKFKEATHSNQVANKGEREALEIFLAYSRSCLDLARSKEEPSKGQLLTTCLSILIPITQFCLNKTIWRTDIGKLAIMDKMEDGWRQVTRKKPSTTTTKNRAPPRRKVRRPPKPLNEWFQDEDKQIPLSNAVTIPASQLMNLWGTFQKGTPERSRQLMNKVNEAMQKLRESYTDLGVEKASLQVALALLKLVGEQCCENPFIVLQQAAIFASHGTKRGNCDVLFREVLPEASKCPPEEALVILGRADCFQAVQFPYEAAFLCSYVARVCNLHRESSSEANSSIDSWNNKWMVVGILCYNLSVMIRAAVGKATGEQAENEEYDPWDEEVVDELLRCRVDAVQWQAGEEYSSLVAEQMETDAS